MAILKMVNIRHNNGQIRIETYDDIPSEFGRHSAGQFDGQFLLSGVENRQPSQRPAREREKVRTATQETKIGLRVE